MIARFTLAGRRLLSDAADAAADLSSTLLAFGQRCLSDAHAQDGEVEFWLAFRQAAFIGLPIVLIGIGLMAVLP
ncbi:hypothetical protein [uncultured Sphingobium sp.]|uniref:hypothetical protein n=1 Tax=uncultured Sphingobium sp. TaxID=316087 RepID=UPI00259B0501|nr:hypothetical protein [uncultured Sphingobium sp.]